MAVQFETRSGSRTSEYRFLPEEIVVKPELNGRHVLPDIDSLIASILRDGQLEPVAIRADGNKPVLVSGYSRWRAVLEINKRKLAPVPMQLRCTYVRKNEQEGFVATITENRFRNTTTELDDAFNIKRLIEVYGQTEEQVAALYFPVESKKHEGMTFVHQRLALAQLTKGMQKAFEEGRLKGSAAVAIAKLSEDQQKEILAETPEGKLSAPHKARNSKPTWKEVRTSMERAIERGAIKLSGKQVEIPDEVVEWLQKLLGVTGDEQSASSSE